MHIKWVQAELLVAAEERGISANNHPVTSTLKFLIFLNLVGLITHAQDPVDQKLESGSD